MSRRAARRTLFVFGCPRSGTTWAQLLLDRHPEVVTAPETHVFSFYLDRLERQWEHERAGSGRREQGSAGLSQLLSEEDFEDLCRSTAERVLEHIARRDPQATVVLEKSPQHACQAEWIARLFPEALFLHVIRDPRDTVASLVHAGRGWGRDWAPSNAIDAARYWRRHVVSGRRIRHHGDRYRELRFEALKEDAEAELTALLAWLGLEAPDAFCEEAVEACRLERLRKEAPKDLPVPGTRTPEGFFRKGESGGWSDDLTRMEVRAVEHLCADLMQELGYARAHSTAGLSRTKILMHDAILRVRESLDWQLQRLARSI